MSWLYLKSGDHNYDSLSYFCESDDFWTIWNFIFKLKVLEVGLKTGDLDIELQGQIGIRTCNMFVLFFLIHLFGNLLLHMNCLFTV